MTINQKNVDAHKGIATHLETAAKHHSEAAKHHEVGDPEKAGQSTKKGIEATNNAAVAQKEITKSEAIKG
jgi:hypothetical protein